MFAVNVYRQAASPWLRPVGKPFFPADAALPERPEHRLLANPVQFGQPHRIAASPPSSPHHVGQRRIPAFADSVLEGTNNRIKGVKPMACGYRARLCFGTGVMARLCLCLERFLKE